ncbi:MAG: RDD family protein [Pseudanabaena sp. ELA607]
MEFEPAYNRYAIASLNQRLGALIVDFLSCWFLAELLQAILTITTSATLQFFAFLVMWVIFRVFIAAKAQGQTFGRWLMSVRIVDAQYGRTATVGALFAREAVVFICSLILLKTITSTLIVFAWIPFVADAALAIADGETRQTIHDRLGGTIAIQSRRGFALPTKITNFLNQAGEKAAEFYGDREDEPLGKQRRNSRTGQSNREWENPNSRSGRAQSGRSQSSNNRRRYAQRDLWDDMAASNQDNFSDDGDNWDDSSSITPPPQQRNDSRTGSSRSSGYRDEERGNDFRASSFNDMSSDLDQEDDFNSNNDNWDQEPPPQPSARRPRRGKRPRG